MTYVSLRVFATRRGPKARLELKLGSPAPAAQPPTPPAPSLPHRARRAQVAGGVQQLDAAVCGQRRQAAGLKVVLDVPHLALQPGTVAHGTSAHGAAQHGIGGA